MIPNFKQFVIENLSDDEKAELRSMGFAAVDLDGLANAMGGSVEDNALVLTTDWDMDLDDFGIDSGDYPDVERKFWMEISLTFDFEKQEIKAEGSISQKDMNLDETVELEDIEWAVLFDGRDPGDLAADEIGEALEEMMDSVAGFDDPTGFIDAARLVVQDALKENYGDPNDDDGCGCCDDCTGEPDCECGCEDCEANEVSEKKKLKFHHSDAPDAKGKFKELGVQKLADWLIRTRGGNMQKITGSLNQQINFNKRKNPSYAKKMESTREAVKRKLNKRKDK